MIIKVSPDKEKVKSMLALIENRLKFAGSISIDDFPTMAAENYYEVIKELSASLLLLDGLKATGEGAHKELILNLKIYKEISSYEVDLIDDLRDKRNKSSYEGRSVGKEYVASRKGQWLEIIGILKKMIDSKLRGVK